MATRKKPQVKRNRGRQPVAHKFTQAQKDNIQTMAGLGMRYEDIAVVVGCARQTLKKYAMEELKLGKAKARAQISQTAFKMANSGRHSDMTKFWLQCQAGWSTDGAKAEGNDEAEQFEELNDLLDETSNNDWAGHENEAEDSEE